MKNDIPAFPIPCPDMVMDGQRIKDTQGMTLRDYFAGQAIVGLAEHGDVERLAEWAYDLADAMLAQRNKEGKDA